MVATVSLDSGHSNWVGNSGTIFAGKRVVRALDRRGGAARRDVDRDLIVDPAFD